MSQKKITLDDFLIETSRLKIRNLKETDLPAFHKYRSEPDIAKYQGFGIFSLEQAMEFIMEQKKKCLGVPGEWIQYGIEDITMFQLVGDCAIKLQDPDPRIAEIGITIAKPFQRHGYAREVMQGLLNHLFKENGILRIVETVDSENIASIQLMKSLGFRQEVNINENILFKGRLVSEFQFVLLKQEWEK